MKLKIASKSDGKIDNEKKKRKEREIERREAKRKNDGGVRIWKEEIVTSVNNRFSLSPHKSGLLLVLFHFIYLFIDEGSSFLPLFDSVVALFLSHKNQWKQISVSVFFFFSKISLFYLFI